MKQVEHLIERFVPENYDLFIDINREEKTFEGNVIITGEALQEDIKFHQKDLTITKVEIDGEPLEFEMENENDAFVIHLGFTGPIVLDLDFLGDITDNMDGIYPCYYTEDKDDKELIATQFESHFAREAFPCIDEPAAKATFDISLHFDNAEDNEIAISNMPEINQEERKDTGIWQFAQTPRMSTYLVAFAFGDMQAIEDETENGTLVKVYSTKAHEKESLEFALDIAKRAIEFYEEYFGIKYPLPQSLHLALPDFSAGAMENWGLVTYREIRLLVDENSSFSDRMQVALTICHELAHMWFGNLVTMEWWDNLWLNESFANLMEYVAVDHLEPEWDVFREYQVSEVPAALRRDATAGVQSVQTEVKHPDAINTIFDSAIVYAKGSRLLHMLRQVLGEANFRIGLNAYFNKHAYQNTTGEDLWEALSAASGLDIASFMNPWLLQSGYPVLTASLEDDEVKLEQEQFFIGKSEDSDKLWPLPLSSSWDDLDEDIMSDKSMTITDYSERREANGVPLHFNDFNDSHYIVNYKGELYEDLLDNLADADEVTKYQTLQERTLLADAGVISYADLIPLLLKLKDETSYLVLAGISQVISRLKLFFEEGSEAEAQFKDLVITLFKEQYEELGFEEDEDADEDVTAELSRQIVLANILYADYEPAVKEANELFEQYQFFIYILPAPIRGLILNNQMKHYESDLISNQFMNLYKTTLSSSFKRQLSSALAYTTDQETLESIVATWQDKDIVKPQDLSGWYARFLRHKFTREYTWNWACEEWDWIKAALGGDMSFDAFVSIPGRIFSSKEGLAEFKEFFEPQLDDVAIKRNIEMAINEISARIELKEKDQAKVQEAVAEI